MTTIGADTATQAVLIADRRRWGADRFDEVWDGTYVMTPFPNPEHQKLVGLLYRALAEALEGDSRNQVFPGVNISDRATGWEQNFRAPDIAVFLADTAATEHEAHWQGAADFLIEITSPGDHSREKLPFYGRIGTREVLLLERAGSWRLELWRQSQGNLVCANQCGVADGSSIVSETLQLSFRLEAGDKRPRVVIVSTDGRVWQA